MILDVLAFVVMGVLLAAAIWIVLKLGAWPGKIAREREHPQAEAINVCGWIGILTLGLAWPVAFVWAYTRPVTGAGAPDDAPAIRVLSDKVAALEREVRELRGRAAG